MIDTASIIIAIISMVGALIATLFTGYIAYVAEEHKRCREIKAEVRKYSDPLLVTAHDLQDRLWELLETRITKFDRENHNGKENLDLFTCYLLAQFLAWTHILKIKTQFLAFYEDKSTSNLRKILYKINDELSTSRYDQSGWNFRLWPGHQLAIAENMMVLEKENCQLRPMGWHQFKEEFGNKFTDYFRWFRESITDMLDAKEKKADAIPDQRLRRLQHLLIDLINTLDSTGQVQSDRPPQKCGSAIQCDCFSPECNGAELAAQRSNRSRSYAKEAPTGSGKEEAHSRR